MAVGGKLQQLNPFLDKEGILRVGGRLNNSPMPFNQKHSIILPKAPVTALIIEQEHRTNHPGYPIRHSTTLLARRRP
jgi:hypothetical protein